MPACKCLSFAIAIIERYVGHTVIIKTSGGRGGITWKLRFRPPKLRGPGDRAPLKLQLNVGEPLSYAPLLTLGATTKSMEFSSEILK
ncbi:hypothetical protein WN51_03833 [Melipona quadrifasciata]|uniref:Uncharacterized protein n=1 Tax=Melipona quadrifasciata TaxID=166423 RepID=A0A0N0U7I3_9HYME|nr:hypothetical protein WN51_03833 [Melipona quadrifasciata]